MRQVSALRNLDHYCIIASSECANQIAWSPIYLECFVLSHDLQPIRWKIYCCWVIRAFEDSRINLDGLFLPTEPHKSKFYAIAFCLSPAVLHRVRCLRTKWQMTSMRCRSPWLGMQMMKTWSRCWRRGRGKGTPCWPSWRRRSCQAKARQGPRKVGDIYQDKELVFLLGRRLT